MVSAADPLNLLDLVEGPKGYTPISKEDLEEIGFVPAHDHLHSSEKTLYNKYWGRKALLSRPGDVRFLDAPELGLRMDELFLFNSYIEALSVLKLKKQRLFHDDDHDVQGCIILGTPGTGKTTLLQLYLMISLALEHPILVFTDKVYFYTPFGLFVSKGPLSSVADCPALDGLTVLVDLDDVSDAGVKYVRTIWCIGAASSSDSRGVERFMKHLQAHKVILDNPKLQELFRFYNAGTQSQRDKLSVLFDILGPNLRELRGFSHSKLKYFMDDVAAYLHQLPLEDLSRLFEIVQYNPSMASLEHAIFTSVRYIIEDPVPALSRHGVQYRVRSLSVMRLITQAYLRRRHQPPLCEFYLTTHKHLNLGTAKGWVFECLCHDMIAKGTELKLLPMKVVNNQLHRTWEYDAGITVETLSIQPRDMIIFLSGASKGATRKHTSYYVPGEANNPTFDGFLHSDDPSNTLHAFQMRVGYKHSMKAEGLQRLVERAYPGAPIQLIFLIVPGSHFTAPKPPKSYESQIRFFTSEMPFSSSFDFPVQPAEKDQDAEYRDDSMMVDWSSYDKVDAVMPEVKGIIGLSTRQYIL
ncbi:hypothetical protein DL96DRAFT_1622319 [Flagelloscypha sp. PMI_526]|nr:hypothetical protein DL96DRAFT_1622319 [Flagelloscypha sp. PMI_526]